MISNRSSELGLFFLKFPPPPPRVLKISLYGALRSKLTEDDRFGNLKDQCWSQKFKTKKRLRLSSKVVPFAAAPELAPLIFFKLSYRMTF